jgi:two-component system, OmpR family, phosphate regulon sensor histidine kinase PhoR
MRTQIGQRWLGATLAVAVPGGLALLALLAAGWIGPGVAAVGSLLVLAASALVALLYVRDIATLLARIEQLAAGRTPPPQPERTALATDLGVALDRAGRAITHAQQALAQRAAAAEAALDSLPQPLLVLDLKRRVLRANRAAEALLGAGLSEHDLAETIRYPAVLAAADAVLADRQPRAVDFELKGTVDRHLRARLATLSGPGEDGQAIIVVFEDLTTMRRVDQMRVDFVANVSHELRTPLAALQGFIETLQGAAKEDAVARERFLAIMHEQASRMARLVADLLSLSRIELDEHIVPETGLDLARLLQAVCASLAIAAERRQMTIRLDCPPELPMAIGDHDQIAQVVQNLVDNAIKYGRPASAVEVMVRAGASLPAGGGRTRAAIRLAVRDQGEGISPEHLPRLTERFYRVDASRSRALGGTGLGLAIVKHIVNRHRGQLAIESEPGVGSCFTVTLPVDDSRLA